MLLDFIKDDGGRAAAGYKGETGDCVVRAVSILNGGTAAAYKAAWADCLAAGKEVIARQRKNRGKGNPSPGSGVDKKACLLVYARSICGPGRSCRPTPRPTPGTGIAL